MGYVKIKVKHLLILFLLIGVIGGSIYGLRSHIVYQLGHYYDETGQEDIASVYYKRVTNKYPNKKDALNAANNQIKDILEEKRLAYFKDRLHITGRSSGKSGYTISYQSLRSIMEDYNALKKYHHSRDEFDEYSIGVALMNWFGGEGEVAIDLLENMAPKSGDLKKLRDMHLIPMSIGYGRMDEALSILQRDLELADSYHYVRQDLMAYYAFNLEDYEAFKTYFIANGAKMENMKSLKEPYVIPFKGIDSILRGMGTYVNYVENHDKTDNTLEGYVTLNGEPLPRVMVYVKENQYKGHYASTFISVGMGERAVGFSDENGYFKISNIPNGLYGIGVQGDWQRLGGKVVDVRRDYDLEFTGKTQMHEDVAFHDPIKLKTLTELSKNQVNIVWDDELEDVEKYRIALGEIEKGIDDHLSVDFTYYSKTTQEKEMMFDLEEEREKAIPAGFVYSDAGIDPSYVLEPLYHRGNYAIKITAYNKEGNILGDNYGIYSNRPYDTIHINGEEWSEGDQKLLDGNVEGAIEAYEQEVEENPDSLHAIKPLAILYRHGWKYDEEAQRLTGKNEEKALTYYEQLNQHIPDNYTIEVALADLYKDLGYYDEALTYFKSLAKDHGYLYSAVGDIYLWKERFNEALDYYIKAIETSNRDDSVHDAMMLCFLYNDLQAMEDLANTYKNDYFYAEYPRVVKAYKEDIETEAYEDFFKLIQVGDLKQADAFLKERQDALSMFFKGIRLLQQDMERIEKREAYEALYNQMTDDTLKELMKYFGKGSLRTNFGEEY